MHSNEGFLEPYLHHIAPWLYTDSLVWTIVGLSGGFLFSSRFVLQWLQSERSGRVVVPPLFWHISFWGSLLSLVYALHLDKLPIILSYFFLPALYGRNLWLLRKGKELSK
ncbi:lipid-A-disaccharide synthase N-terminal domain-containing protein [Luteibacter sp.]|uniref:lipid-A-disaccharide synthase N-terminal domain-containing protein n=1 Tax=Luteibacter sp. TaxID=1886636 RepID=UPI0039C93C32